MTCGYNIIYDTAKVKENIYFAYGYGLLSMNINTGESKTFSFSKEFDIEPSLIVDTNNNIWIYPSSLLSYTYYFDTKMNELIELNLAGRSKWYYIGKIISTYRNELWRGSIIDNINFPLEDK